MAEKKYIEREAAIAAAFSATSLGNSAFRDVYDTVSRLRLIPAADVRPVVRGEWGYRWKIHGDGRRPTELFPCTVCGFENTSATNFCPNCGADMREES